MLKPSLQRKLEHLLLRHEELAALLSDNSVIQDAEKFRSFSKEYSDLAPVVDTYSQYKQANEAIDHAKESLATEQDAEMKQLLEEELAHQKTECEQHESQLQILLLPQDERDSCDIYLEVRAGTGGDEASLFAGDLFRMYSKYAESKGWQVSLINHNEGEHGGYKEVVAKISGENVYRQFKFESGAHRVQRVPATESQGRIHTSACTVAILPEMGDVAPINIETKDLRIDTFRSSGAGGQHVNTTDSAIRITHIPTGVVVECQDERSQHKNKARAMSVLQAKLFDLEQQKKEQEQAATRKKLVGSGDRSERIRTYNFPQGRMTDHRINLTLYKLDQIIEGDLDQVIEPLLLEHQADLLAELSD